LLDAPSLLHDSTHLSDPLGEGFVYTVNQRNSQAIFVQVVQVFADHSQHPLGLNTPERSAVPVLGPRGQDHRRSRRWSLATCDKLTLLF
jgi:hypothetical protein